MNPQGVACQNGTMANNASSTPTPSSDGERIVFDDAPSNITAELLGPTAMINSTDTDNITAFLQMPTMAPSNAPTSIPSLSSLPTTAPSLNPTIFPSSTPTMLPTMAPTYNATNTDGANFVQEFTLVGSKFFNDSEQENFETLMESYTANFAHWSVGRVNTTCTILDQKSSIKPLTIAPAPAPPSRLLRAPPIHRSLVKYHITGNSSWQRSLQNEVVNTVSYKMLYESNSENVSSFSNEFLAFINDDPNRVTGDMNSLGIRVVSTAPVARFFTQTPQPTTSPQPSAIPTSIPTASPFPSNSPSSMPTTTPTIAATVSTAPSIMPSVMPAAITTAPPAATSSSSNQATIIIVVIVVVVASIVMIGLFVFYRRRKKLQGQQFQASASVMSGKHKRGDSISHTPADGSWNAAVGKALQQNPVLQSQDPRAYSPDGREPLGEGLISPSESLVSNQSLLSAGNSMAGDSGDEADTTQNLQDEFDHYKDQNLEKMRTEVEGNLSGFDGMMSQAMTKALMDDEEINVEPTDLLWGGQGQQSGAEIESSALCEVTDWLKRNDNASLDRK